MNTEGTVSQGPCGMHYLADIMSPWSDRCVLIRNSPVMESFRCFRKHVNIQEPSINLWQDPLTPGTVTNVTFVINNFFCKDLTFFLSLYVTIHHLEFYITFGGLEYMFSF